jgi:signal transduction histidine kinase
MASTVTFGLLMLALVGTLIWTSTRHRGATAAAFRDAEGMALASDIERSLLAYQRISNLYVATGEPELGDSVAELLGATRDLLRRAREYVGNPTEEALMTEITGRFELYVNERIALEARDLRLSEIVQLTRPDITEITDLLAALRELKQSQVAMANLEAQRIERLSTLAGIGAAGLVGLGLLAAALGVRRYVIRPTLELLQAITRFRAGETQTRAREFGSHESSELAQAFNDMADQLARQREQQFTFLAGIAHDLRNPLSGLKVAVHLLGTDLNHTDRQRTLGGVDRQVDRLSRMIDDLLDATRIEAGQLAIEVEDIDARSIAEDVVRHYAPTSPQHAISLELPPVPVPIRADPVRLGQVLGNLVSNAIKFSPDGGPVQVSLATRADEAVLAVTDRGVGIEPEALPELFDPFRRSGSGAAVAPGVGLGLSVARSIIEAHGGSIEVESAPEAGSTFRLHLPLATSHDRPAALAPADKVAPTDEAAAR